MSALISRRRLLGTGAAAIGLPLLDAMVPSRARADAPAAPKRLLAFYVPNGIHMRAWTPSSTGASYSLSPILTPLAKVKSKLLVLTGLDNSPAHPDGAGDHAAGTSGFLTCRHVVKTEGSDIKNGISMDQVAAQALGKNSRLGSLQLGIDGGTSVGNCDSGYSCAYTRNISWAGDAQPLPKMTDPKVLFDQLFGGADAKLSAQDQARRAKYHTSVLDHAIADATSLSAKLGASDRRKLDEYLSGIRDVEMRLQAGASATCVIPGAPKGNLSYQDQVKTMCDLMVLAFQCDVTRIITFMMGNAASGRSYDFLGIQGGHHDISHHEDLQSNFDKLQTIDTWEVTQLAYLLEQLDGVQEGAGTLLDNCAVFFSSEIEDGNAHRHTNLPVLLAGSCGGALPTGRHIKYSGDPIANLYTTILQSLGVKISTFGDNGTGPLTISG